MSQLIFSGKERFVRPLDMDSLHTTEECDLKTPVFKFSHYQTLITMNNFPLLLRVTHRNHNEVINKTHWPDNLKLSPVFGTFYPIKVLERTDEQEEFIS